MYYDDSDIERSTEQKLLWHLLPLLCLVSMAGMLNRLSLDYAGPAMAPSLHLTAAQLETVESLFCVGYLVASLPAALLLPRFGARRWITGIVLACGAIATAHAFVSNAASLYAARLLLGVAAAGLLPGVMFYLVQWMPPQQRAKGIAVLIAGTAVVPILAAPLAHFLLPLGDWFGLSNWRFLFVVEGLPTLWLGLHVPARVPQAPTDAGWLPASERFWLLGELRRNAQPGKKEQFSSGLWNAATWKLAVVQGSIGLAGGSLGVSVPLAMRQAGYVSPGAGAVVMIAAAAIGVAAAVLAGLLWDRRSHWRRALAVWLALAGICLGTAAALPYGIIALLMLALVAVSIPAIVVLTWVLAPCVLSGAAAAAGFAVLGAAGTLGAFAAPGLALVQHDASGRCLILAAVCLVSAWFVRGLDGRHPARQIASEASPGE
jgi:MFS transporter, ACS family, tartrate transporter